jgi:hypothetical protein
MQLARRTAPTRQARYGSRLCENRGIQSVGRKSFLIFVSKEEMVLRLRPEKG